MASADGTERRLAEVYGVSRAIPLTYVSRPYVDDKFVTDLTREKHIVVFGGSKQGKTCLRKHCLKDDDYVVVQCHAASSRTVLYEMILKCAGASVALSETRTISGARKFEVSFEGRGFEIDPADPSDVIRALHSMRFSRYVVLEDFHYLREEVQREIAIDLKAFHEQSQLCFVIVGVWLEANRLVTYNGDLAGRLIPIDADQWKSEDLLKVIAGGEPLLNVRFPDDVKAAILDASQDNVGILQETCYKLCEASGVSRTMRTLTPVGSVAAVKDCRGATGPLRW
jgi:hypothetical protein